MRKIYDINNQLVEVGDLVIRPKFSCLTQHYVLSFTKHSIILSCNRDINNYIAWKNILSEHDDRQYVYDFGDLLILEKNTKIPEELKKFIKYNK